MDSTPKMLLVDDQPGDIGWLIDRIADRGYEIVLATNERDANERLDAVKAGTESYAAAIFDVMVAVMDLEELLELDERFFRESRDTGIRLARRAREELRLSAEALPIAALTIRDDEDVTSVMEELGIPLLSRLPSPERDGVARFLDAHLPDRASGGDGDPRR